MSETRDRGPAVRATLLVLGTFVLGIVAGAALLHIASRSVLPRSPAAGMHPRRPGVEFIRRDLDLTPEQEQKIRAILDETHERMRAEADATRDRIRELLTPEQRQRFDAMHPGPLGPMRRRR